MPEKIPAGRCSEHGIVFGPDVDISFPVGATCQQNGCGRKLEVAGYKTKEQLEQYVNP